MSTCVQSIVPVVLNHFDQGSNCCCQPHQHAISWLSSLEACMLASLLPQWCSLRLLTYLQCSVRDLEDVTFFTRCAFHNSKLPLETFSAHRMDIYHAPSALLFNEARSTITSR
jgi:hypothetical protein